MCFKVWGIEACSYYVSSTPLAIQGEIKTPGTLPPNLVQSKSPSVSSSGLGFFTLEGGILWSGNPPFSS